jgi:hypothetical protein
MSKQMSLNLNRGTWGGRRTKCGRKRIHSRGVSHRTRESVNSKRPLHVNFKYRVSIRNKEVLKILKRALINSGAKGLRILHYSVQSNHMHFILEADNNKILETGMRSLTVTIAKGIKKGKVQLERYHLHVLKTIRETKNAISYVLFNEQKHSGKKCIELDGYSSLHSLDARALARKAKLTLVISRTKTDIINITEGRSFLANTALDQLIS